MTNADMRFCPACATPLALITLEEDGGPCERLRCPACGWTHWNNPTPVLAAVVECADRGGRVLLESKVWLRGRVDSVTLNETPGGTSTLKVGVEGPARGLGRRSERMRSDADQRLIDEADAGFRRVAYAGQKSIYWGGKPPERAGSAFGGGGGGGGYGDVTVRPFEVF